MNRDFNFYSKLNAKYILKTAFSIFILVFLITGSTFAQKETCRAIGEGSDKNNDYPFAGGRHNSYLQQIYTAEELKAEYIVNGDNITGISFNYFWDTPTKRPIKIFMGNTQLQNISADWIPMTELSEVYASNCQEFSKGSDNWTRINLNTNFTYTGENIVIAVLMNKEDASDPACFTETNGTNRFYIHNSELSISRYVKPTGNTPITFDENTGFPKLGNNQISGTASSERSNIKLCKIGPACPSVSSIIAKNIYDTNIDLDWADGNSETSWTIEYGQTGFTQGEGETMTVNSHPANISGLIANTTYDFYVKANCSVSLESIWEGPANIRTTCSLINSDNYLEEFNNDSPSLNCWTIIDANGDKDKEGHGAWKFEQNEAKYFYSKSNKADDWLISPKIKISEGMVLTFDYKAQSLVHNERFSVYVIEDSPFNIEGAVNIHPSELVEHAAYKKIDPIPLNSYKEKDIYIGIKCESDANMNVFYVDNFRVYKPSSENKIISFTLPTQTGPATITDNDDDKRIDIEVAYSTDVTKLIPTIEISEFATISPASGAINDFTYEQGYSVKAENGDIQIWKVKVNKASAPSSETKILSFTFADQEGKEEIDNDNDVRTVKAKINWEKPLTNISPDIKTSPFATISPASGTAQDFTNSPVTYTVTAEDGTTQTIYKVSIEKAGSPVGAHCDNPVILELSNLTNPHQIKEETTKGFGNLYFETEMGYHDNGPEKIYKLSVNENSLYTIEMNLITNTHAGIGLFQGCPSENVIITKATNAYNTNDLILKDIILKKDVEYYLMVDNHAPNPDFIDSYSLIFTKDENPSCMNPNDLKVSDILQTTAIVSWSQILNESAWEIKYGIKGFNPNTDGTHISNNPISPYNLSNLSQDTEYDIYIRSKCSNEIFGDWSNPTYFKTIESCPRPVEISAEQISENSAVIKWNGHNANNWIIEYKLSATTSYESITTSTNPHTLTGLSNSSAYNLRIKSKCSDTEESKESEEITFFTACGTVSNLPYHEDFENYGAENSEAFPKCWSRPVTYSEHSAKYPSIVVDTVMPTRSLKLRSEPTKPTFASTPIFSTNLENLILEFKLRRIGNNAGVIVLGTMTDVNDESTFSEFKTISPENNQTNDYKINLSDYSSVAGSGKSIAFKHVSNNRQLYYLLDDVKIREKYSDNEITSFIVSNMLNEAIINHDEKTITGTISISSNIKHQIPKITISEEATISPKSGVATDFTNPVKYTVTAEDGTHKEWTVTLKKAAEASPKNDIISFTFPEQIGNSEINYTLHTVEAKIDWDKPLTDITPIIKVSPLARITPGNEVARDFTNEVEYIVKAENQDEQIWKVVIRNAQSPEGATCENPVELKLSELTTSTHEISNQTTEGFGNMYDNTQMESYDNGFDKIYKLSVTEKSIYSIKMHSISDTYAGIGLFKGCPSENNLLTQATNSNSKDDLLLENIALEANTEYFLMVDIYPTPNFIESYALTFTKNEAQTCLSPNDLSFSDLLSTTVKLNWTPAFNENEWEIKYGPFAFNPDESGTSVIVTSPPPYSLNGLNQETEYDVFIRSKCSDTENGEWSKEAINFKTTVSCPKPTSLKVSDITINSAVVKWDAHNASKWTLEYKLASANEFISKEVNTNSFTLEELSGTSRYTIRVKAKCDDTEESLYSEELSFNTKCNIISTYPFFEDFQFESASRDCWTIEDVDEDGNEYIGKWNFNYGEVQYSNHSKNNANDWLISPRLDINEDNLNFTFKYKATSQKHTEKFSVHIISAENPKDYLDASTKEVLQTMDVTNLDFITINPISLSEYKGQKIYIAIKCESEKDMSVLTVDDFSVSAEMPKYEITSSSDNNGRIDPEGLNIVKHGESITFTLKPNDGFEVKDLRVDGTSKKDEIVDGNKYTFNNVVSNHKINVTFKHKMVHTYSLTATVVNNIGGSITPSQASVDPGKSQKFEIKVDPDYELEYIKDNDIDKTTPEIISSNTYILNNINEPHTISVKFKKSTIPFQTFNITASVVDNIGGTINPSNKTLKTGETQEFKINTFPNYEIEYLTDNGVLNTDSIIDNNKYILSDIQDSHNIMIKFKLKTSIIDEEILKVRLYPNPSKNLLNLEVSNEIKHIEIMTISGKLIHKQDVNTNKYQFNTSRLAEGNYFIKIYTDKKITIKKFTVKR